MANVNDPFEYRGVENLVYAEVIVDDKDNYLTGEVKDISPVATISRSTANNSEAHYYDNKPLIVIITVGADTVQFTVIPPAPQVYAEITGQDYNSTLGAIIEGQRNKKYFAVGYKYQGTDGRTRYCWRYKGMFSIPEETYQTETDGVETNNVTFEYTGVSTTHKFTSTGKSARAMICDDTLEKIDYDTFFDIVHTPDNTSSTGGGGVNPPEFLPSQATFSTSINVTLATGESGRSIKYTTDGSDPKTSSTAESYSDPIRITATTTIKAYAYVSGSPVAPSETVSKTYIKI